MNIVLRIIALASILFVPGYLLFKKFFYSCKLNVSERLLLTMITSFIMLILNMFVLTGRFTLPYFARLLGVSFGFSLINFYILLIIEVSVLTAFQYKNFNLLINIYKRFKDNFKTLGILLRRSIIGLFIILLGLMLIVTPHALALSRYEQPATALVWYYHHLTVSALENRVFPETMCLYGKTVNFDSTYVGYNLLSGAFYSIIDCDDTIYLKWMTLFSIVISFVFALAFFNRLVPFPFSLAGVVIVLSTKLFIYKLATFRTEALAICFMFASLWIIHKAISIDDDKLLAVGGATIAIGSTINSSISFVNISMILSIIIIKSLFDRRIFYYLRKIAILFLVSLLITITLFFLSVGKIPVIGTILVQGKNIMHVSGDPTWEFRRVLNPELTTEPSFPDYMPYYVYKDFLDNSYLILLILLSSIVGLWKTDENKRKIILSLQLFTAFLFFISIFFYKYYNTYVPARVGFSRVFPYIYISLSLMPVVVLKSLPNIAVFSKRFNRTIRIHYKPIILISLIFIVIFNNLPFLEACYGSGVTSSGYQALVWLRENTDLNSTTILTNEWTNGAAIGISGRNFLNDGDAPYLRPHELPSINSLIVEVGEFYRNPQENIDLLEKKKVTHVMVSYGRALRGIRLLNDNEISEPLLWGIGLRLVYDLGSIKIFDNEWLELDTEENDHIEIYRDDNTFWSIFKSGSGKYNITLDSGNREEESGGLLLTICDGNYRRVGVVHKFHEIQDYSIKDFLCLYFRGEKSYQMIKIIFYAPDGQNYFRYEFRDAFKGWARLIIPFDSFEAFGTPYWTQVKSIYILFDAPSKTGKWYLGRVIAANYPMKSVEKKIE